jgi:bifunctional NMN adenylyltransferase/nudix hydrolase
MLYNIHIEWENYIMNKQKFDFAVYIGRFQPLHDGHIETINTALGVSEKVIILVGSADAPRSPKNPFTYHERATMIKRMFGTEVEVRPLIDYTYDNARWKEGVQAAVSSVHKDLNLHQSLHGMRGAIVGHDKDDSTWYLKVFPQWEHIDAPKFPGHSGAVIDATRVRGFLFNGVNDLPYIKGVVPRRVLDVIEHLMTTQEWANVVAEHNFIQNYDAKQFDVPLVTADAMVVSQGKVLLIERKNFPGKGLLALPGGFINLKKDWESSATRELKEETSFGDTPLELMTSKVFSSPGRDPRGRCITQTYMYATPVPVPVEGRDDAARAFWADIKDLPNASLFYADHWHMITNMLEKL